MLPSTLVIYLRFVGCNRINRTVTKKWLYLALMTWIASLPCTVQARQLAVISDTSNGTTNLSAGDLVKIFNTRSRNWPDGRLIVVVVRDPSSVDMQLVLRKLLNMIPEQAQAFIQAHHSAILIADSDDAVLHFVSTTRGAIGIIDLYSLTQDVNVVKIDGKLPVEQGYLLRGN